MNMRWTPEDLKAFEEKTKKWKKEGTTRTNLIADKSAVDIDAIHHKRDAVNLKRKYKNEPTDGFHSRREAKRHQELSFLEKAGKIDELKSQVPFRMVVNGYLICTYIADFTYVENGRLVVEDAKGFITREFRIKAKLMNALHGIEVKLT